jgi:hypothetical protein
MLVLVQDAAEPITSAYLETGDLPRVGDRRGSELSRRVFAMPW